MSSRNRSKQQRQLARKSSSKKHHVERTPTFSRQSLESVIPNIAILALYKPHKQPSCNPRRGEQAHARLSDTTSGFDVNHQTSSKPLFEVNTCRFLSSSQPKRVDQTVHARLNASSFAPPRPSVRPDNRSVAIAGCP